MMAIDDQERTQKKPVNILVIEENDIDLKILLRGFERSGFLCNIFPVANTKKAIQLLKQQKADSEENKIDVVLFDVTTQLDASEGFIKDLRSLPVGNRLPVICMAASDDVLQMSCNGVCDNYIAKSLDSSDLIARIREQLHQKSD